MEQIIAKLENDARNELHAVLGMLELIARDPLTEAQSDYLRACKASADRLLRSIQNISVFVSPETGEAQNSVFHLPGLIADLANLMEMLAKQKGLHLSFEIRPGVPNRVAGDPERLQDVLIRLLDNAIRFTEHGGVQLIATGPQPNSAEPRVRFEVCDTGPGIPADVIARLPSPLWEQADQGLGLPIVRKLVLSMGGELTIGPRDGGGSSITISVPFRAAPAVPGSAENVTPGTIAALNILVAEDSDDSYYVLEGYLREQKHRLTRALNGVRAVELFQRGQYDLVLMDIHMPEMDGYAATLAIRAWETGRARARVPIVVLSSDSQATQLQNGAKVGCSGYLTKPTSQAALLSVLRRYAGVGIGSADSGNR